MNEEGHVLLVRPGDDGKTELASPTVGIFEPRVSEGDLVAAGESIGTIEVLGVRRALIVPEGMSGRVATVAGEGKTRAPVHYGQALCAVSTSSATTASKKPLPSTADGTGSLAFVAPMSGRFYSRPSPSEAPFISAGDVVRFGQTVGLLEVMKTFNRLVYQGDDLPDEATVAEIAPNDGDDVVRGDVILALTKC